MTLPEILRETLRLVGDIGCDHVTIARADEHAYQVRFTPDKDAPRGFRMEGRRWCDGGDKTPTRGTTRLLEDGTPYVGWARWSTHLGFGIEAVLADDWRFVEGRES